MKFTVTPLGGGRADTARVVDSIVRYLQPPPKIVPSPSLGGASGQGGVEQYYADRGEEAGRWLGRTAESTGLTGTVARDDFASVLAGRDPHTGERLITAQGSAGRRPTLGAGAHTKVSASGVRLYNVADSAAVLGVSHREVERMLEVGESESRTAGDAGPSGDPEVGRSPDSELGDSPDGSPATYPDCDEPAGHGLGTHVAQPGGSYLVPVVESNGSRWVPETELRRCQEVRNVGVSSDEIRSLGASDDQLTLSEAARLIGVTTRYLRGVARHYEDHRIEIDQTIAAGRQPRKAFLEAHRGTKHQWLVTREHLAQFLERRRPPAVESPTTSP